MRPAAGIVGVVAHPVYGLWQSTRRIFSQPETQPQRSTRVSDGVEAVRNSTKAEQIAILRKFEQAKSNAADRRKAYEEMAERLLRDTEIVRDDISKASSAGGVLTGAASPGSPADGVDAAFERDLDTELHSD
jgi:sterol 3beta-glucosyltransferase